MMSRQNLMIVIWLIGVFALFAFTNPNPVVTFALGMTGSVLFFMREEAKQGRPLP